MTNPREFYHGDSAFGRWRMATGHQTSVDEEELNITYIRCNLHKLYVLTYLLNVKII